MAYAIETLLSVAPPWAGLVVSASAAWGLIGLWYRADRRARQWERAWTIATQTPRRDRRTRVAPAYHAPKASDPLPSLSLTAVRAPTPAPWGLDLPRRR